MYFLTLVTSVRATSHRFPTTSIWIQHSPPCQPQPDPEPGWKTIRACRKWMLLTTCQWQALYLPLFGSNGWNQSLSPCFLTSPILRFIRKMGRFRLQLQSSRIKISFCSSTLPLVAEELLAIGSFLHVARFHNFAACRNEPIAKL